MSMHVVSGFVEIWTIVSSVLVRHRWWDGRIILYWDVSFDQKEEWRLVLILVIGSLWAWYMSWCLMILFASFSVTSFSQAMLLVIRWATAHRAHHSLAWMQQLEYGCTYIFLSQWATVRIFIIKNELPASPTFLSKLHCCYATVYATCQICQHDGVFQLNAGSCAHPNERLARAEPSLLKTLLGSDLHRTGIWMSRNLAAWQWFASRTEWRHDWSQTSVPESVGSMPVNLHWWFMVDWVFEHHAADVTFNAFG